MPCSIIINCLSSQLDDEFLRDTDAFVNVLSVLAGAWPIADAQETLAEWLRKGMSVQMGLLNIIQETGFLEGMMIP